MPERIGDIKGDALFEFLHESPSGCMISYVPKGYKWSEFLFDFWDFTSQLNFEDEFTTSLCINHNGHSKIYCNWRVLDQYKVKYMGYGLTRNMVDIPERNVKMEEHFCFKYSPRSKGSPQSLVQNLLKEGMACLYDRYYVNNDYQVLVGRETFRCYTGDCHHDMDGDVPEGVINCLPQSYYNVTYPPEGILRRVSLTL